MKYSTVNINGSPYILFKYEKNKVLSVHGVENTLLQSRSSRNSEMIKCKWFKSHFV
jgi:hypothetical protein